MVETNTVLILVEYGYMNVCVCVCVCVCVSEWVCKIFSFSPLTVLAQCSMLYLVISRDTENTQVYNTFPPVDQKYWSTGCKLLNTTVPNT